MRRLILIAVATVVTLFALVATGCDGEKSLKSQQRSASINSRAEAFARAEAKYPLPYTENFPLRRLLVEMTEREDLAGHPWYTYVLADTGNVIGYYVTKTPPINKCNFLSSTEDYQKINMSGGGDADALLPITAPSLDGIYYGGGKASGACNQWVFEDLSTGALITLGDVKYFVADKPLNLEAEEIRVK
jgi:hypothetical protein